MTIRQTLVKFIYPLFSIFASMKASIGIRLNAGKTNSYQSFYALQGVLTDGTLFEFAALPKKKVLLVNLASDCGFTPQYKDLQKLQDMYKDSLLVLGFPANDFKGQEPGTDSEIEAFCQINYGVTFPLFQKHSVFKPGQNNIFRWLTHKELNGWNDQQPVWNFCKYLVDENGNLQYYFPPSVSPLSKAIITAINTQAVVSVK